MRIAALYDIHGNLPALEAVLAEVDQADVDQIVVGGDVLIGPLPNESLDLLLNAKLPVSFLYGNCETDVLTERGGQRSTRIGEQFREIFQWNAKKLSDEHAQLISNWPGTLQRQIDGLGNVLFCHATPDSDTEIFTRQSPESRLAPMFAEVDADVVVCGHTHMQFDRAIGGTRILNAGSVGMPFGKPGAHWMLLGPGVDFRITEYDLEAAATRIKASDYPQAEQFAEQNVLNRPSEEQMLAAYAAADEEK